VPSFPVVAFHVAEFFPLSQSLQDFIVAAGFSDLIEAQKALKGLDTKTKQLVNIAIQTANRNRGTDACNDGKKRVQPVKRLPVQWY
jgi:alkylhydroperoxidase/carboxymuconolactone decarboxylase family protein YurZ